jgi:DMSO/TMAO reductase YedYZ molybdopterin-dependent catalytic subunit
MKAVPVELQSPHPSSSAGRAAIAGVVAGAVAMAAAELLAGLVPGVPSLVIAVASLVIALQPAGAKDLVATLFGTNDKLVLNAVVIVAGLLVAAGAGVAARRSVARGAAVFVAFGALALVAALRDPLVAGPMALLNVVVAASAGILSLVSLVALSRAEAVPPAGGGQVAPGVTAMPDWARRRFLLRAGALAAGAVVAGYGGRYLLDRQHPGGTPVAAGLPAAGNVAPPLTPDQSLDTRGLTPLVVANDDFYRIDTALLVPQVDAASWHLDINGMVDRPLTFTYADLLAMPLFEQYVTISCVSNQVGGELVGNTLWTGVRLKDLLAKAGVQQGATQIVGRSVDGFTVGFPTPWALDPSREPMVVLGMNRVPLPAEHGYPARLIVPGLYGYVSATKWLSQIELTTREAADGYWIPLGWAKDGPILTQSRIDTPRDGDSFAAAQVDIGGLAWAPDRGISQVEVRVDDGPWQAAMLSRAISKATWVQWTLPWPATPGQHAIEVRATDGTGEVQTDQRSAPAPDGARGHHRIQVSVR